MSKPLSKFDQWLKDTLAGKRPPPLTFQINDGPVKPVDSIQIRHECPTSVFVWSDVLGQRIEIGAKA